MLEWIVKHEVGIDDQKSLEVAKNLTNREEISFDTVKEINDFLITHKDNAVIENKHKDNPWMDSGYILFNLWGGASMIAWSKDVLTNE